MLKVLTTKQRDFIKPKNKRKQNKGTCQTTEIKRIPQTKMEENTCKSENKPEVNIQI